MFFIDDISGIEGMLEWQARWRYEKAREYPHDTRNHGAVKLFERMADEVRNGDFDENIANRLIELMDVVDGDAETTELVSMTLRDVGFGYTPASVDDLLRSLIHILEPAEPATT